MIKVKYTSNPFDKNAYKIIEVEGDQMLLPELRKAVGDMIPSDAVFVRGSLALKDTSIVNEGDDIYAVDYIAFDPATWATIVTVLKVIFYVIAIATTIYSIVQYSRMSKKANGNIGDGMDAESQTYSWDGIRTTSDVGISVPVVYGEHRVGGNVINAYISTDGDNNYLNMLLALCEGEIESISDIYINDQPVANFDGIDVYSDRLGANDDSLIPNFEDLFDNYTVAQGLNDLDDDYTYTTQSDAVEGFEVQLSFPIGIFQQNEGNGNIEAWDVGVKIEYSIHGEDDWTTAFNTTISAKQRTEVKRYFRVNGLDPEQYDIRVTRTTAGGGFYTFGDMSLAYVIEIRTDDLAYPNTAKLGIKALATNQISGSTPNVTCVVKGRKVEVPKVMYDGEEVAWEDYYWNEDEEEYRLLDGDASCTWDGETWVERYSANPVWCIRDLLTNTRFGLGDHISTTQVDRDSLLAVSRYCEEKVPDGEGGFEKRMRLDVVIDSTGRALDILLQLMTAFRGIIFYSGTGFKMEIDREASPVQLFGQGNIVAGSFQEAFKSIKETPNVIEVQFLDKDEDYKQQVLSVLDEEAIAGGDPIRKESIRLFVTRKTQALRDARYLLNHKKYCKRSVSFKASADAIACQPGDVISVSHDVPQWGFSGRVGTGSTTTNIVLDRSITIESGKTYQVMIRFADDTIETQTITTAPGTVSSVDVGTAFSQAPGAYDVYSVGELDSVKKDFRIMSMKRSGDLEVEITAIEYNELIYDADTVVLPEYNASALSLEVPLVESLALTERLVKLGDGTIETAIDVWFRRPDANSIYVLYKKAKIFISDDGGDSYSLIGETEGDSFSILGGLSDGTEYTIKVVSVATDGRETGSTSPTKTITLVGKSAKPADVAGFIVNQYRDRVVFSWSANEDVDLFGYEIRKGESWASGEVVATQLLNNRHVDYNIKLGTDLSYWIKAIDTSGNYSENATEAVITIDNVPFTNIVIETSEQTDWDGTKSNTEKVGDNLEISSGELSGTYTTDVIDIGYLATFKIGIDTTVIDSSTSLKWSDMAGLKWGDMPLTKTWGGEEVAGAVSFRIKTSEDNITWSDWRTWQAGDYYARYYQIEMTLTRSNTSKVIRCTRFDHLADLPDVDENVDGEVTVAGDGDDITFTKTFHEDPAVGITILSGDGVYGKVSSLDTTGCNIKLYDEEGTAVVGTFRLHVHGI